eukprot:3523856-Pyramimonas_sp.AAC.1
MPWAVHKCSMWIANLKNSLTAIAVGLASGLAFRAPWCLLSSLARLDVVVVDAEVNDPRRDLFILDRANYLVGLLAGLIAVAECVCHNAFAPFCWWSP